MGLESRVDVVSTDLAPPIKYKWPLDWLVPLLSDVASTHKHKVNSLYQ